MIGMTEVVPCFSLLHLRLPMQISEMLLKNMDGEREGRVANSVPSPAGQMPMLEFVL
jgi:hypothetical protein